MGREYTYLKLVIAIIEYLCLKVNIKSLIKEEYRLDFKFKKDLKI